MPVEAVFTTDFATRTRFGQPGLTSGVMTARRLGMVQVKGDGATVNEFARTPQMVEARANVRVLAAPAGVIFIEPVDGHQIVAPERHVAADDAALFHVSADDGKRPAHALCRTRDFAREYPVPEGRLAGREGRNKLLPHKTTAALDPEFFFRQRYMIGDIVRMRHAVGISENQIVAGRGSERLVQDDGFAETVVRMPDVSNGHRGGARKMGNEFFGRLTGAVIGEQYFLRPAGLALPAPDGFSERTRLVVGANYEGCLHFGGNRLDSRVQPGCRGSEVLLRKRRKRIDVFSLS